MVYNIFFLVITLYVFLKTIGYGIYELKENNNIPGFICIIVLSLFSIIFSNIMMWTTS